MCRVRRSCQILPPLAMVAASSSVAWRRRTKWVPSYSCSRTQKLKQKSLNFEKWVWSLRHPKLVLKIYITKRKKKRKIGFVLFSHNITSFFVFVLGMVLKIELVKEPKRWVISHYLVRDWTESLTSNVINNLINKFKN